MLRHIATALVLAAISLGAAPAYANDASTMIDRVVAMIKENNKSDCKEEEALKCLGISESTCVAAKSDVLDLCTVPLMKKMASGAMDDMEGAEMKMAECAYDVAVEKHDIDPKKYESCVAANANDSSDAIMQMLRSRR